jgi:hypothetical protein
MVHRLSQYATSLGVNEGTEREGLAPAGFELRGPTRGWYWLSTTVLNTLIMRGTPGAIEAIRFIDEKEPDENLKRVLVVAEEYMRQKTWVSLLPSELIDLVAEQPKARPANPHPANEKNGEKGAFVTKRSTTL